MDSLRSQFTAECVTMGRDGLWATLLRHAPPPEHREMEQVIGSQRIKRNKNLWTEVVALREIVADAVGMSCAVHGSEADSLGRAVCGLLERVERARPEGFPITLAAIYTLSVEIHYTLDCEHKYLEAEVAALTSALDAETDSLSERPCTAASSRSTGSCLAREPRHAGDQGVPAGLRRVSKVRSRLPCKPTANEQNALVEVTAAVSAANELEPGSPIGRGGSSKFRNKLQAAKDENYFIDDYELGVS